MKEQRKGLGLVWFRKEENRACASERAVKLTGQGIIAGQALG